MKKPLLIETTRMAARLLLQGKIRLTFDQLPFNFQNVPVKKRLNFLIQGMQLMTRSSHLVSIPPILQIEPSNRCNLHCLTCATGAGLMNRPAVQMPFDMYRRVIDQVKDHVCLIVFWSWGEPFVNKDAFRMIRYAKDKGISVHSSTNGHFFNTRDQAKKIIDSGLDSLIVAVDGIDQQTYEKYRKGGNLQRVEDSIKNIVKERDSRGVNYPRIILRFLVMKHNEHQVDKVTEFARGLGVDAVTFRSAVMRRPGIDFEERLSPSLADFQRFNYKSDPANAGSKKSPNNYCHRPYANLTIFSNGDVVTCENDFNASLPLGNVDEQGIRQILSSGKTREFFKEFRKNLDQYKFCRECENRYIKGDTANVQTYFLGRELSKNEKKD